VPEDQPPHPAPVLVHTETEAQAPPAASRLRRLGALATRLVFDLLVIDAAAETWLAASPMRLEVAAAALVYFALTAYVMSKGGRIGSRGWLMDPVVPLVVFLGFLVACSWTRDGLVQGVQALRQPTPVVLSGALAGLLFLATVRMAGPGGARSWWLRVPIVALGAYACVAFGRASAGQSPFIDLVTGHGFWLALPQGLQGTWLGAFVLLPLAFLREVGAAIARLGFFPYIRWMFVFGFGCWIVFNAASL
jgi:hypothetical protein